MATEIRQLINKEFLSFEHPAIITERDAISYYQLFNAVEACSAQLKVNGIKEGARVVILSPNSLDFIITLLSLWSVKAVACPMNAHLPQEALYDQLNQIDAHFLISEHDIQCSLSKDSIRQLSMAGLIDLQCLASSVPPSIQLEYSAQQESTIIFTTGSNGKPKPVLHTFENHIQSALSSNKLIPFVSGDQWLLSLPLYHVGGLGILFRSFLAGGTVVIAQSQNEAFELIANKSITHISCVGTQLARLIANDGLLPQLKNCKALLVGGSALGHHLLLKAHHLGLPLYITYGLTEMASQVATSKYPYPAQVLSGGQLKISETGEILVKGEKLFKGYIKEEGIDLPIDKEGWFHTGDLGRTAEDGGLTVTGRMDNMFISGGENIQPEEIEQVLTQMDSIEQAIVVAVADDDFGFRPAGMIKFQNDQAINREEMTKHLMDHLPKFKIPDHFYSWPIDDKSQRIKVNRQFLAQQLLDQKTRLQEIH